MTQDEIEKAIKNLQTQVGFALYRRQEKGVRELRELSGWPAYKEQAGKFLKVKSDESGVKFDEAGGGGPYIRGFTKVVAANDSLDKVNADYVCNGTDDQVEIQAAIDAVTTTGGTVKLMEGTFNIVATITPKSNVILFGSGYGTVLKPTSAIRIIYFPANTTAFNIEGIRFDGNAKGTYCIQANTYGAYDSYIKNCWFIDFAGDSATLRIDHYRRAKIINNVFDNCKGMLESEGDGKYFVIEGNSFNLGVARASTISVITVGSSSIVSNNMISGQDNTATYGTIRLASCSANGYDAAIGNHIYRGKIGIDVRVGNCSVVGNRIWEATDAGIRIGFGDNSVISGNVITGATTSGILVDTIKNIVIGNTVQSCTNGIKETAAADDYNMITSNNLAGNTNDFSLLGIHDNVINNQTEKPYFEQKLLVMKNTSGGALVAGDIVVLKSVAAGNEVITSVTAGDNKVFGMAVEAIAKDASGYFQVLGKTVVLKVDGTTDIAIGDYIGTAGIADYTTGTALFTNASAAVVGTDTVWAATMVGRKIKNDTNGVWYKVSAVTDATHLTLAVNYAGATTGTEAYTITTAGVGIKAGAGAMVFAMALEAYTTDDSAGVIDALLVTPRKI